MSRNTPDPERPKRIALYAVAVSAMVFGFVEGIASHGTHGRLVEVIGVVLLYAATKSGGSA